MIYGNFILVYLVIIGSIKWKIIINKLYKIINNYITVTENSL